MYLLLLLCQRFSKMDVPNTYRINCQQFERAFSACKTSRFHKVSWRSLSKSLISFHEIDDQHKESIETAAKTFLRRKESKSVKGQKFEPEELQEILFEFENSDDHTESESNKNEFYKPLDQVQSAQKHTRTKTVIAFIRSEAEKNKVSVNVFLGIVLKQMNYMTSKRQCITPLAEKLIKSDKTPHSMPVETATHLQQNLHLGREKYLLLKKIVSEQGVQSLLPSWYNLRQYQKAITPNILHDTKITGVRFSYTEALITTISQIINTMQEQIVPKKLVVTLKDGVDGSGGHAIYQQLSNAETRNMIMFMFCILNIGFYDMGTILISSVGHFTY